MLILQIIGITTVFLLTLRIGSSLIFSLFSLSLDAVDDKGVAMRFIPAGGVYDGEL